MHFRSTCGTLADGLDFSIQWLGFIASVKAMLRLRDLSQVVLDWSNLAFHLSRVRLKHHSEAGLTSVMPHRKRWIRFLSATGH